MTSPFRWRVVAWWLLGACSVAAGPTGSVGDVPTVPEILDRLVRRSAETARRDQEFEASHSFTLLQVLETRDSSGEVKKREEVSRRHEPGNPVPVELSEVKPKGREHLEVTLTHELLARFRFTYVGTERVNGRDTWVLDFVPAAREPPSRAIRDRIIGRLAGRVWIDVADAETARLEVNLTESVGVVGGVVGSLRHCRFSTERERMPPGHWYTRRLEWFLEARRFLRTKQLEFREERTGVELFPDAIEAR
ncbi:MAG: hypothetical protein ACYDC1_04590 [Limisphaerales bacterium]